MIEMYLHANRKLPCAWSRGWRSFIGSASLNFNFVVAGLACLAWMMAAGGSHAWAQAQCNCQQITFAGSVTGYSASDQHFKIQKDGSTVADAQISCSAFMGVVRMEPSVQGQAPIIYTTSLESANPPLGQLSFSKACYVVYFLKNGEWVSADALTQDDLQGNISLKLDRPPDKGDGGDEADLNSIHLRFGLGSATLTLDVNSLYSTPSSFSPISLQGLFGQGVTFTRDSNGYRTITTPDGFVDIVRGADLTPAITGYEIRLYRHTQTATGTPAVVWRIENPGDTTDGSSQFLLTRTEDGTSTTRLFTQGFAYYPDGSGFEMWQMANGDGSLTKQLENHEGLMTKRLIESFMDGGGNIESQSRVTTTGFFPGTPAGVEPTVVTILGQEVSRSYTVVEGDVTKEIRCRTPGASTTAADNLVTVTTLYPDSSEFAGEVQRIDYPDGTLALYEYEQEADDFGAIIWRKTTVFRGSPNTDRTAVIDGTYEVTEGDYASGNRQHSIYDIGTNSLVSQYSTANGDGYDQTIYSDGTMELSLSNSLGVYYQIDRDGRETDYDYYSDGRLKTASSDGITIEYLYSVDATTGIETTTTNRHGTDGAVITTNISTALDGTVLSSTDALNRTTTYAESTDGAGHSVKTTTYANAGTRIETYYKDGTLLSVGGTAAFPRKYEYGVLPDGTRWNKEIRIGVNGSETEWTTTYTDMLDRVVKTVSAGGAIAQNFYNDQGQLIKDVDPDGVIHLYQYNAKGEQEYSVLDMNRNGQADFGGADRVTRTVRSVALAHGTVVQRTAQSVLNADGTFVEVSALETSADENDTWMTRQGLTTHTQVSREGSSPTVTVKTTTTAPDGSRTETSTMDERELSESHFAADNTLIQGTTFSYDPHRRISSSTDARNGTTSFTYWDDDRLKTQTTPPPDAGSAAQVTQLEFDLEGNPKTLWSPDGGRVDRQYSQRNQLLSISGAGTYAISYTYDPQGRMKTMTAGAGTTTWNYSPETGLLIGKLYQNNQGPSYTYTPAGRVASRMWARGATTTYHYNNAGELADDSDGSPAIEYSDGVTPNVRMAFDRRGRPSTMSDAAGVHTLAYNDLDQKTSETITGGLLDGASMTMGYDELYRRNTLEVRGAGTLLHQQAYGYDGASRLSSISDDTHAVSYGYVAKSSLLGQVVYTRNGASVMTTTKSYDALNRLSSIATTKSDSSVVSSHAYTYDTGNRRTRAGLKDGSYWMYGYDASGQVSSASKRLADDTPVTGQQLGYSFDNIGNRTATTTNERGATYSANSLNEYTQRTVPGYVDVMGDAEPAAKVSVNNQPATRQGRYFYKELAIDNSARPILADISVVGVRNNVGPNGEDAVTSQNGRIFIPATPEIFGYDEDGNLTGDGRWNYTWDGENRLGAMENVTSLPDGSRKRLEFAYDGFGRRVSKTVYQRTSGAWTVSQKSYFIYDGWNLVAECNADRTLRRSFLWGQDLSGALQEGGGVGALLAVKGTEGESSTMLPYYDGNGNVAGLINASTEAVEAVYEYGPFGELLRTSGSSPVNPFQFSTKYVDAETGLIYFGYRYYQPKTGRWISRDPISENGGENLFAMVANDAISGIDPLGLYDLPESFLGTDDPSGPEGCPGINYGRNWWHSMLASGQAILQFNSATKHVYEDAKKASDSWQKEIGFQDNLAYTGQVRFGYYWEANIDQASGCWQGTVHIKVHVYYFYPYKLKKSDFNNRRLTNPEFRTMGRNDPMYFLPPDYPEVTPPLPKPINPGESEKRTPDDPDKFQEYQKKIEKVFNYNLRGPVKARPATEQEKQKNKPIGELKFRFEDKDK